MEHVACIFKNVDLMRDIGPKFDTEDYYGNLPLHYAIMKNDSKMVAQYHPKFKDQIDRENYKNETVVHVAAKHDSLESFKELVRKSDWIEQLLKRNYVGDTPLHIAAKRGSIRILEFFKENSPECLMSLRNDFGLTPEEAAE